MFSIRRSVTVVALCAAVTTVVPVQPASASQITLYTYAVTSAQRLDICAVATFSGALLPNITLALQVDGVEEIGLGGGANPLYASPIAANLTTGQTLCAAFALSADSTVDANYTAEVVGLSPTPFMGSCAGVVARLLGGSWATLKTC